MDLRTRFEAKLSLRVNFCYTIAQILEVGVYVSGNILRATVDFVIENNGAVPIQLFDAIMGLSDIV